MIPGILLSKNMAIFPELKNKTKAKQKTKKSPKQTHLDLHINSLHLLKQNKTKNGASSLGWQNDLTGHLFEVDRMAASSVTGERN